MKPRILFLDDDDSTRKLLSDYFGGKKLETRMARTSKEAIQIASTEKFDLAIFDIYVAGENGLELLTHFKTAFPRLPVVMLTGATSTDALTEEALARGASGFMCKTDPLDDLYAAIRSYLPEC